MKTIIEYFADMHKQARNMNEFLNANAMEERMFETYINRKKYFDKWCVANNVSIDEDEYAVCDFAEWYLDMAETFPEYLA